MNISYLLSVIDLYLMKDNENNLNIEVEKLETGIKFSFYYKSSSINKTYIKISESLFLEYLQTIIDKIQGNLKVIDEKIDKEQVNKYSIYMENNRVISFKKFNKEMLEKIRLSFNNINSKLVFDKLEVIDNNDNYEQKLDNIKTNKKLSFSMGFSSFITIFLSAIWFLDIFMIALWIFKALNK